MKLQIYSDLHLEFENFSPLETEADLIILAGDIHVKKKGIDWAKSHFSSKPVLYILGNHEYYGNALPKHLNDLKQLAEGTNIHILENDRFCWDGVTFLGCTLWTDFNLFGNPRVAGFEASYWMNDYRKIRVNPQYRKLRSIDTALIHRQSLNWLSEEIAKQPDGKTVIITHHAPSLRSLPEAKWENILSAAYTSNLDEFIERSGAALWIHGHIHTQQDYTIGTTRILCNPRGYPDKRNPKFISDFVVEI